MLKILIGVGLGFLLFTNPEAQQITGDLLRAAGDAIAPKRMEEPLRTEWKKLWWRRSWRKNERDHWSCGSTQQRGVKEAVGVTPPTKTSNHACLVSLSHWNHRHGAPSNPIQKIKFAISLRVGSRIKPAMTFPLPQEQHKPKQLKLASNTALLKRRETSWS